MRKVTMLLALIAITFVSDCTAVNTQFFASRVSEKMKDERRVMSLKLNTTTLTAESNLGASGVDMKGRLQPSTSPPEIFESKGEPEGDDVDMQDTEDETDDDENDDETEDEIEDETEDEIEDELEDEIEDELEDEIEDEIEDDMEDETDDDMEDETEDDMEDETEDEDEILDTEDIEEPIEGSESRSKYDVTDGQGVVDRKVSANSWQEKESNFHKKMGHDPKRAQGVEKKEFAKKVEKIKQDVTQPPPPTPEEMPELDEFALKSKSNRLSLCNTIFSFVFLLLMAVKL